MIQDKFRIVLSATIFHIWEFILGFYEFFSLLIYMKEFDGLSEEYGDLVDVLGFEMTIFFSWS